MFVANAKTTGNLIGASVGTGFAIGIALVLAPETGGLSLFVVGFAGGAIGTQIGHGVLGWVGKSISNLF